MAANSNGGRRRNLLIVTVLFLGLGVAWWLYETTVGQFAENTDNAQVDGDLIRVMAQVKGTVINLHAEETDFVAQGQLLAQLDDTDARLQVAREQAALGLAVRETAAEMAVADRTEAQFREQTARFNQSAADLKRRRGLAKQQAISTEELQHAEDELIADRSAMQAAGHAVASINARVGGVEIVDHPRVRAQALALRSALISLHRTRILAPVSGRIARREISPGQQVAQHNPLFTLAPEGRVWVNVNLKENQLANLRIGQPVKLSSDVYGDEVEFEGMVAGLTPATGSLFGLLPAQNATGNWIKIVQRLTVRVVVNAKQLAEFPLPLGASLEATIDTHNRDGEMLTSVTTQRPVWNTNIYQLPETEFDAQIFAVIEENLKQVKPAQ